VPQSKQLEKVPMADEHVEQVLELAERLRSANGGELDDNAILAVAEATGAPVEYVRLAVRMRGERKRQNIVQRFRTEILQLDPSVRLQVQAASLSAGAALSLGLERKLGFMGYPAWGSAVGVIGWVLLATFCWLVSGSRNRRNAAISGAIFGAVFFTASSLASAILGMGAGASSAMILVYTALGFLGGGLLHQAGDNVRAKLGVRDPNQERRALLQELVQLQEKLKSSEQGMAFLSLDIVGSTRLKQLADPLSVEYTFNEYHKFVEMIVRKHGGRIHSTAGDGVTCAFETPLVALACAKNIQAGLIELNTFRNKIGHPIVLRAGVHAGQVALPDAGDVKSLEFAGVIDLAAHIQKVCPPGGVAVTEATAQLLPGGAEAVGRQWVEASETRGVVWLPRMATS
jgi:class 3 adenylate cyclase